MEILTRYYRKEVVNQRTPLTTIGMLWNLATRTLFYDRGKLAAGLVGVIFSVVLVNVQGGLFLGLIQKASLLIDRSNADIWVGHHGMHNVDFAHDIPMRWIQRVKGTPGVAAAEPMRISFSEMSLPDGKYETIALVGVTRHSNLGRAFNIVEGADNALDDLKAIVVDQCDNAKLGSPKLDEIREIGGHQVRIAGKCHGILSFLVAPYVFTSHQNSAELSGTDPSKTSYFLVQVDPRFDPNLVLAEIQRRLPDATVQLAQDYSSTSIDFWMTRTGIGLSFGAATLMGLLVGLVMVGQTLYAMVLDRINEFATLKALGSSESEILVVLLTQALIVATVGTLIGTVISYVVGATLSTPRTEILISQELYMASAALVLAICTLASGLPYIRVRRVDPYSVLQG